MRISVAVVLLLAITTGCRRGARQPHVERSLPSPDDLSAHCRDRVGAPRVIQVTDRVLLAIGYDLASTILVRTDDGNVVVDTSMSPARAREVKAALLAKAPGPTRAVIFTHSHVDHIGGASAWTEPGTEVWATEAFREHLVKQYGLFRDVEARRGRRQFGAHVGEGELACSSLGRRPDLGPDAGTGARMPTKTFQGAASFTIGGVRFELVEAHGETDDQLFVWLPEERVLLAGDNYYHAFPNLFTIRGTRPRPIGAWIRSLDEMRRKSPLHLVPSHTTPVSGEAEVQRALRDYRDGIQWVRDESVRAANRGEAPESFAARLGLPPHLRESPDLRELYGQIDWSARAVFGNELGWFGGDPEELYPLPPAELARREIEAMGGADAIAGRVEALLANGAGEDVRFALHQLARLRKAGLLDGDAPGVVRLRKALAQAERAIAQGTSNTNGRAYLLESAHEIEHGAATPAPPPLDDELIDGIPLDLLFEAMPSRLRVAEAMELEQSLRVRIQDNRPAGGDWWITVRRGIAEITHGEPLAGTPPPVGTITTNSRTWKRVALKKETALEAIAAARMSVDGEQLGVFRFTRLFQPE